MSASRQQDYYSLARAANRQIWDGMHALLALQDEWNALDYGTTLADGVGENTGLVKTDIGSVVFDTATELKTRIFDTAFKTNMAKLL